LLKIGFKKPLKNGQIAAKIFTFQLLGIKQTTRLCRERLPSLKFYGTDPLKVVGTWSLADLVYLLVSSMLSSDLGFIWAPSSTRFKRWAFVLDTWMGITTNRNYF